MDKRVEEILQIKINPKQGFKILCLFINSKLYKLIYKYKIYIKN